MRLLLHLSTKIKVHTILVRNICSISHYGSNNVIQQTSKFKTFFAITAFRPNNDGKLALFPIQRNYSDSPKPMSKVEKLKKVVKDYGTTVVIFHIAISLVSLGISYFLVSNGKIDMRALGFSESFADRMDSKTGVALMTLSLYKIFFPIRIIITLTCAPLLIKYLRKLSMPGLEVEKILTWLGFDEKVAANKLASTTGTFVTAYALHKVFAPVRISVTLAAAPFIVRYLRNIGWLTKPKV